MCKRKQENNALAVFIIQLRRTLLLNCWLLIRAVTTIIRYQDLNEVTPKALCAASDSATKYEVGRHVLMKSDGVL